MQLIVEASETPEYHVPRVYSTLVVNLIHGDGHGHSRVNVAQFVVDVWLALLARPVVGFHNQYIPFYAFDQVRLFRGSPNDGLRGVLRWQLKRCVQSERVHHFTRV